MASLWDTIADIYGEEARAEARARRAARRDAARSGVANAFSGGMQEVDDFDTWGAGTQSEMLAAALENPDLTPDPRLMREPTEAPALAAALDGGEEGPRDPLEWGDTWTAAAVDPRHWWWTKPTGDYLKKAVDDPLRVPQDALEGVDWLLGAWADDIGGFYDAALKKSATPVDAPEYGQVTGDAGVASLIPALDAVGLSSVIHRAVKPRPLGRGYKARTR